MKTIVPSQVVSLIEQMFPDALRQEQNPTGPRFRLESYDGPRVSAIVDLIRLIPDELIIVEGEVLGLYLTSLKILESAVATWQTQGGVLTVERVPGITDDNPLTILLKVLRECPDQYPSASTAALKFITEAELRENLRLDLSASNQALANNEWKAATVLAGSVVEALLLWKLATYEKVELEPALNRLKEKDKRFEKINIKDLEREGLSLYISLSEEIGAISQNSSKQARLSSDYRNLIHPGRSVRLKESCTRATALTAVAAVERLIDEFSK